MSERAATREDPAPPLLHDRKSAFGKWRSLAFPLLLLGSIALRMVALDRPMVDAHNTRQCQTAILTKNMMAEGGLPLATHADWMGDAPGRLFLEMPFYNWAVIGMARAVGDLDMAGKLVSIAFWGLAFWLNHRLLHRTLSPAPANWGDLLFALSPLSIFFGQAFQPEMLVMTFALGLMLAFLKHQESGSLAWFALCVAISVAGVTLKANELSHLFVLIAILAFAREGWTCLLKLRYWVFIALLTGTTYVYGSFITEVNSVSFHEWTTGKNLAGFLGGKASRLDWRPYARSASYVVVLVLGPAAAGVAAVGLARMFRKRRAPLYICWALSLVFFYLVWGPGTSFAHSYYNLPALPVACAAFGIGASLLVARARAAGRHPAHWTAAGIVALLLVGGAFGSLVLFWPDRSAADGAAALRRIMAGREGFVFCYPNHTAYGPGYTHYTTLFYYAGARGWNENPKWTTSERRAILAKCRWVIELRYDPVRQFPLRERTFFSYRPRNLLDTRAVRAEASFRQVLEAPAYRIWERDGTPLPQPP